MKKLLIIALSCSALSLINGCKKDVAQTSVVTESKDTKKVNQLPFTALAADISSPGDYLATWHGIVIRVSNVTWNQTLYPDFVNGVPVIGQVSMYSATDGSVVQNNPIYSNGTIFFISTTGQNLPNNVVQAFDEYEKAFHDALLNDSPIPLPSDFLTPSSTTFGQHFTGKIIRQTTSETGLALVETDEYVNR